MQQNPKVLPFHLAPQQKGLEPVAYRVYKHSQLCRCGAIHEWSELVSKHMLKSTITAGKYITQGRPIDKPEDVQFNLPIEIVSTDPRKVLFCHECYSTASLKHLPYPPKPKAVEEPAPAWVGSGAAAKPKAAAPKAKPKAPPVTIDDLLI